jgi:AcrR family transcriptional regulator
MNETKRSLLDSARRLFATRGFAATSVRDIVADAGANLGAITYHFECKETLFHAVIEEISRPMREQLESPLPAGGSALALLEQHVRGGFAFLKANPDMPRIVLHILASDGKLPPHGKKMIALSIEKVTRIIERGQLEGSMRDGNPRHLAMAIVWQPMIFGIYRNALKQSIKFDPFSAGNFENLVDDVVSLIQTGLVGPKTGRKNSISNNPANSAAHAS